MDWKRSEVESLAAMIRERPVIGVASIHEIPANRFQSIRRELRGQVVIRVSKKTYIQKAFSESGKKNIGGLAGSMAGEVALLFTEMNPFKLFRNVEARKVQAPAKPGHRPLQDVWVPKGGTPFAPGPIVSQLQKVGIPARIERGKVVILEDTVLVKAGEEIDRARAEILSSLGIQPMKVGLDLAAVYEDGTIFDRSILDVDEREIANQVTLAARQGFNLAFNARFFTETTIMPLVRDAHRKARSLSILSGFPTSETVTDLVALAHRAMLGVATMLAGRNGDSVSEGLKALIGAGAARRKEAPEATEGSKDAPVEAPEKKEDKEESVGLGALFG